MANQISPQLLAEFYGPESGDPFLALLTLSHPTLPEDIRLVNNTVDIVSRGLTFTAFPMTVRLPADDGESAREFSIDFDNVGLELIAALRSITSEIGVKLEMILASMPDQVQMSQEELKIQNISYTKSRISSKVILDNFLNTEMTSERYTPTNFRGLF